MANPVTSGTKSIQQADYCLRKDWRRQAKPYDLVLPYYMYETRRKSNGVIPSKTGATPTSYDSATVVSGRYQGRSAYIAAAKNAAYDKLLGRISDRSNWGENLGQLGESVELIRRRATQLGRSIRRLRRGDPSGFAYWFAEGFAQPKSFARKLANDWLEFSFAIKPTVQDIYAACDLLQSPVLGSDVAASSGVPFRITGGTYGYPPPPGGYNGWEEVGIVFAKSGCRVAVSNPNLWLANSLGLLNPFQIAWQLTPGSFLLDWFLPVEQFLGSMTDFLGLEVTQAYTTYIWRSSHLSQWSLGYYKAHWSRFNYVEMQRQSGIATPTLTWRPWKVPGVSRCLNAVSLLVTAFTGGTAIRHLT